jgi:DNA (cytosine-5)-methyltransferase 1
MRFGSVCSGIEAASVAWEPLGWTAAWFSEIEPFPCAVLKHHYPDVPNLGDMTKLPDLIRSGQVEVPDILCGGTPCQAFSVAGLRQSLDDERGNLSLTFCEIADAIDEQRKSIIFWENVPGVLSTKDNAFGCFLGALAGEDDALVPPGGRWANAGFVDGPKRAVAWRVLDAQYFGVAQRRRRVFVVASARADFDPAAVLFEFDGVRRDTAPSREAGQAVANALTDRADRGGTNSEGQRLISMCLNAGGMGRLDAESETLLPCVAPTIEAVDGRKWGSNQWVNNGKAIVQPISIHPHCIGRAPEAGPQGKEYLMDGSAYCMDSRGQPQAVAQPIGWSEELTASIDLAGTIQRGGAGGRHDGVMQPNMAVRRLTPVECERLQGFPDNYTNIKNKCPDGPRYKALGNSWAVPVVRWIGERINAMD